MVKNWKYKKKKHRSVMQTGMEYEIVSKLH